MAQRILIADDVATNRIVLKVKLTAAYYDVVQAAGGIEALQRAREDSPDLILLDVMMPDMDGVSVCKALKADPLTAHIPIIMITAHSGDTAKMLALRAGADEFMSKPLDDLTLLARVRSLLRARDTEEELRLRDSTCRELGFAEAAAEFETPATVALIAPTKDAAMKWKSALIGRMQDRIVTVRKEEALADSGRKKSPDIFVIASDLDKPDEGLQLLSELRSRANTRHSAIIMVVPDTKASKPASALDLGANDLMFEGFNPEEMALRLQTQIRRKKQADRLRETVHDGLRMAVIDPLTGLYNRRYAQPHLQRIARRAKATDRPFAVMVLDLDHFKTINDNFGHSAGDAVLCEVAARIKNNLRGVDMVARIGGEEFLVAMPDTSLDAARLAAERLCRVVRETPVSMPDKQLEIPISVSIGVSIGEGNDDAKSTERLVESADQALFSAKSEGRDQVTFSRSAA